MTLDTYSAFEVSFPNAEYLSRNDIPNAEYLLRNDTPNAA